MGVRQFFDGLISALSGAAQLGPRSGKIYIPNKLADQEIDAAFRGSWLMRKIVTKPATEMTREGRDWQTSPENIELLEAEETRLDLWRKLQLAEVLRALGGAGMVLYVAGDDQTQPLDPSRIKTGGLTDVHVWHRVAFGLGPAIGKWGDPWFGHPAYYEMQLTDGGVSRTERFHPSRVVAFRGKPIAGIMGGTYASDWWWGDSVVEVVKEAVDNVHTSEIGFATLIRRAAIRRLSVPKLLEKVATSEGESVFAKRVQAVALGENSDGITWLDGGDGDGKGAEVMTDQQITWTGIPDIKASYLATAAAASGIPATVLMEKSPDGMNASGDGDNRNWEKEVMARQGLDLRPCLNQIDAALVPSALGRVPAGTEADPKVWWIFAPLSTPTEKEIADTFLVLTQAITALVDTGLIPTIALEKAVQNLLEERGYLPGLREALALLKEDERFPSLSEPDPNDLSEPATEPNPQAPAKGGGQQSAGAGAQPPAARRRANDAEVDDLSGRPFGDAYNPGQARDKRGRWTTTGATFGGDPDADIFKGPAANFALILALAGVDVRGLRRVAKIQDLNHAARSAKGGRRPPSKSVLRRYAKFAETAHTVRAQGQAGHGSGLRIRSAIAIGNRNYTLIERVGRREGTLRFVTMWEDK